MESNSAPPPPPTSEPAAPLEAGYYLEEKLEDSEEEQCYKGFGKKATGWHKEGGTGGAEFGTASGSIGISKDPDVTARRRNP